MSIKAILFDMDGVLIEAKEWHFEALNRALDLFGMAISRVDHLSTFDGLPTRKKLELLSVDRGLPSELHEFINELKQKYTMELIAALEINMQTPWAVGMTIELSCMLQAV